jgi:hypothetical protein
MQVLSAPTDWQFRKSLPKMPVVMEMREMTVGQAKPGYLEGMRTMERSTGVPVEDIVAFTFSVRNAPCER